MKRTILFALAVGLLCACSSENEELRMKNEEFATATAVTLTFSPYSMEEMTRAAVPDASPSGITRAATSIASVVTKLDVWIYESGTEFTSVHQTSTDAGFGSLSVTLDKTKTYTLYAIGHRSSAAATLADGVISVPDDKVLESMYYTTTFSPSTTTSLSCLMKRIVGKFILESTDALPDYADHVKLTIYSTATRYGVGGTLANVIDREVNYTSFSTRPDGTLTFSTNILSTDAAATNFDIRIQVYDDTNAERQNRLFEDVPIRNNYRTTYRGIIFRNVPIDDISFTVDDWQDFDVVEF